MNRIPFFLLLSSLSVPADDPPSAPQPQPALTQASATIWNLDWQGTAGRTYFIQTSLDLVAWGFQPVMAFGDGLWNAPLGSTNSRYFARLLWVDDFSVTTLEQAKNADFDGDGIPNLFEVQTVGSDPLDRNSAGGDTNSNGLADGWELFHFGALGTADPAHSLQPDGLTNKDKADLGLDPHVDYSATTSAKSSQYTYDAAGRLTGVTAPVAPATYAPDAEGNITNAQ